MDEPQRKTEMTYTITDIAKEVGGEVQGDGSLTLSGFTTAEAARPGDLTFAENEDYFKRAEQSAATAVLTPLTYSSTTKTLIRVKSPRVACARVLPLFFPEPAIAPGVHRTAVVAASAQVAPSASIGPHCVVGEGTRIGARCVLQGGNYVGANCVLGEDVHLFANTVLYARCQLGNRVRIHAGAIIGADGFGYVFDQGKHLKVPQVGNVIIQDDVEIGANVAIDRAALGSTIVGQGTKIDNLVQIGHNVVLGEHCILCGQVGVAGSVRIGNNVTLAGQAGLAGHLKIGDHVTIGAQAGVMNHIPNGEKWLGAPAQPDRQMKRIFIGMQRLPELLLRVHQLEKQLAALQKDKPLSQS
jgi:UDP-3-O-[3-hydroxymyristoyl] glucosamine N-acyltransferase